MSSAGIYDAKQTLLAHTIWYNTRRFHKAIKMTPNEKWNQHIHITNQKRDRANFRKKGNNNLVIQTKIINTLDKI
jgi:hypothetical protein